MKEWKGGRVWKRRRVWKRGRGWAFVGQIVLNIGGDSTLLGVDAAGELMMTGRQIQGES